MSLMNATSDAPKDRLSVLRYRRQMAEDARKLGPKEFERKYNSMDKEDRKAFLPNSTWDMSATYDYFKNADIPGFDKLIAGEEKRVKMRTAEEDKFNQRAKGIADQLRVAAENYNTVNQIKLGAPKKFGYTPGETVDPVEAISNAMVDEANSRIASGQGISLVNDPQSDMTCIAGVCTIAANQGVDFSSMRGMTGVAKDSKGRYIPQYNRSFTAAKDKGGFVELPKGEKPRKGDLVQYFSADGDMGELVPHHMEMVTGSPMKIGNPQSPSENYESFNNYALYSATTGRSPRTVDVNGTQMPTGREIRPLKQGYDGTFSSGGWAQVRFYRLSPEAAAKAAQKTQPELAKKAQGKAAFEQSDDFKRMNESQETFKKITSTNLLGDDQGLMMEIMEGIGGGQDSQGLKKTILSKAKNPRLVEKVIDYMYQR